ncbi:MAG: cytochrome c biogenesis protein CcsA [Deltaproteobacteria bacterium]|nr:cytochrome c biogenesis protein CcsA [Deltaproteobacteria bacterium]
MTPERPNVAALMACCAAGWWLAARRPSGARYSAAAVTLGIAAVLGVRWAGSGHPPVFGTFEMDMAETCLLLALALPLDRLAGGRFLRGPLIVAFLTLAHTFLLRTEATPLTISEQSLWIDLHAVLAWCAWVCYFHALFFAFQGGGDDDRATRLLGYGFLAQSAMGFVGAYYGTLLFATAWSWDPVHILGLLSWLLFATALHFRLFFGVTLHRQRYFIVFLVTVFVLSAKLAMFLRPGQSFHVFEMGSLAGGGP